MKKVKITFSIIFLFFTFISLAYAEYKEYGLGTLPSLLPKNKAELGETFLSDFPAQFDWRDGGWITSVKHQGSCGSCWAFGALAAMEAQVRIQLNDPDYAIDLSEQDLVSCLDAGNGWGGCSGQYLNVTCNYLQSSSGGVTNEQCFPYVGYEMNCAHKCGNGQAFKLRSWNFLDCTYTHKVRWRYSNGSTELYSLEIPSVQTIKSAVSQGPVLCGFAVYSDFYSYRGGVYQPGPSAYFQGLHAVIIVGWDDSERAWICKNSWGSAWGDDGYFKIRWVEGNLDDWTTGNANDSTIMGYDALRMVAEIEEPVVTSTTTTVQPEPADKDCLNFNLLEGRAEEPSKVYLFFSVTDCDGKAKADLSADDFEIYEDSDFISKYESDQTILPAPKLYTMSTVLLLDTSGSILVSETLDSLKSSAELFVENVAGDDAQEVAVYLFDGREDIKELVPFTRDLNALKSALNALSKEDITGDPEYDKSTNLNGAVQEGLSILDGRRSKVEAEQLFTGTLLIFTDGSDQAARVTDGEAVDYVNSSPHASFSIGLGGEIDETHLMDLGKDSFVWAENVGDLETAFIQIADEIEGESKKYYVLGYCSPKRAGNHSVALEVAGYEGSLSYDFNADHFGPGCDASAIMSIVDNWRASCVTAEPDSAVGGVDKSVSITITGDGTNFTDGVTEVAFSCGDITVEKTEVTSATEVVAQVTIDRSAVPGLCDITVTTGDEKVRCEDAFILEEGDGLQIGGKVVGSTGIYVEGLSGIMLTLHGADDTLLDTAVTDENGEFTFDGLSFRTYTVFVEDNREFAPEKYELSLEESVEDVTFKEVETTCTVVSMYGEDSEEVAQLRRFRDEVLGTTPEGRETITLYYEWSPVLVSAMKGDSVLRSEIKGLVDVIVLLIRLAL